MKKIQGVHPVRVTLAGMGALAVAGACLFTTTPPVPATDPARVAAWEKIAPRLAKAETDGNDFREQHLKLAEEFFDDAAMHCQDFADDVLGIEGKIAFVMGKLTGDDGERHRRHIREKFEEHFFTGEKLQLHLQSVIAAYLTKLDGQENALLVAIRADLSEQDLPAFRGLPALQSDAMFTQEYRRMLDQVLPVISHDLKVTIGRETGVWVGMDIATPIVTRVASGVAVRMGLSGGILGAGATSGMATLGVGVVVGFALDGMVDWFLYQVGYDPKGEIAMQAYNALVHLETMLLDGDEEAIKVCERLREIQDTDRFSFVREECRKASDRIVASGTLGLDYELWRLHNLRVKLREAALKRLILEGGMPCACCSKP